MDVRDEGRQRLYRLNGRALKPIHDWVSAYERTWAERFDRMDAVLEDLKNEWRNEMAPTTTGTATVTLPTTADPRDPRVRRSPRPGVPGPGRRRTWSGAGGAASAARSRWPRSTSGSVAAGAT